jgi:hypothetical protein
MLGRRAGSEIYQKYLSNDPQPIVSEPIPVAVDCSSSRTELSIGGKEKAVEN